MSINGTLYAPHNCYLVTTFILWNKPIFTMGLEQNLGQHSLPLPNCPSSTNIRHPISLQIISI